MLMVWGIRNCTSKIKMPFGQFFVITRGFIFERRFARLFSNINLLNFLNPGIQCFYTYPKGDAMKTLIQTSRPMKVFLFVLLVLAVTVSAANAWGNYQQHEFLKTIKGKAPTRKGQTNTQVINASPIRPVSVSAEIGRAPV